MLHWDVITPSALEEMINEKKQHSFRIPEHGEVKAIHADERELGASHGKT